MTSIMAYIMTSVMGPAISFPVDNQGRGTIIYTLTGQSNSGPSSMLPVDYLCALRSLLDEIEEETEFEARYGLPLNRLSISEQYDVTHAGGNAGEHWPKRPASDNTLGSDEPGYCGVEATRHQSSEIAE